MFPRSWGKLNRIGIFLTLTPMFQEVHRNRTTYKINVALLGCSHAKGHIPGPGEKKKKKKKNTHTQKQKN
jgi:hypothetical protein